MYDEQYVHIDGEEKYRALLKDSKTGSFVESILDDLSEETLIDFFVRSIPRFNVDKEIYVTTDGFHYATILKEASHILGIRIKRQRCVSIPIHSKYYYSCPYPSTWGERSESQTPITFPKGKRMPIGDNDQGRFNVEQIQTCSQLSLLLPMSSIERNSIIQEYRLILL